MASKVINVEIECDCGQQVTFDGERHSHVRYVDPDAVTVSCPSCGVTYIIWLYNIGNID